MVQRESVIRSEPLRVLQVFAQMNRGGAENMIMNLYRNIDRAVIQFDFIVHTEEKCAFDDEILSLGGKIYHIPRYTGKNHFIYKDAWRDFFKQHPEYKIIHGHVRSTASIYLKIAKKYGLATIAHSHSIGSRGNLISRITKNIMQRQIRHIADNFLACSENAGKWLFGKNIVSKNTFHVAKNAIDTELYRYNEHIRDEIREQLNIHDRFVIGHIGSFTHVKNHKFLINVFNEILKANNKALLLLVGDGQLRNAIENNVNAMGLANNVFFMGVRTDVFELLQAMDIILFPSLYEGLPLTLIEAQASGIKCIVSDRITDEVKITDNVEFVSLNQSPKYWAEQVLKYTGGYERKNNVKEICDAGYDVKENARWLEIYYINSINKSR